MSFFVYILLCQGGHWYVGATKKNPNVRFREHVNGKWGAAWCKRYPPIRIVQVQQFSNELEMLTFEKLTTFKMMQAKGYERVRGANFCQMKPLDVVQLSWDMGQLMGEDAKLLVKRLQPFDKLKTTYDDLIKDVPIHRYGTSKYF